MLKYFMFASILFIACFLHAQAADKISCTVGFNNALVNVTKGCDYCTYREIANSNLTHLPNQIERNCTNGDHPTLNYFQSGKLPFTALNDCVESNDNNGTYKMLICNKDFCNEKCQNGAFSSTLNFSIFGLILTILIPLKLA